MKTARFHALLWIAILPVPGSAAEAPFPFDREQLIEQATASIRAEFLKHPQAAIPDVNFDEPRVMAVRGESQRKLVFVSFSSALAKWGQYVTFELCGDTGRAVPSGAGRVIDVEEFQEIVQKIGPTTRLALPNACDAAEPLARTKPCN